MWINRAVTTLAPRCPRSVISIGNFDGLHLGHQKLLQQAKSLADKHGAVSTVLSFEPHPKTNQRLMRLSVKLAALQQHGVLWVYLARFSELSQLSPEAFVQHILLRSMAAVAVVVGEGFRFGHRRSGDEDTLRHLGQRHGFEVQVVPSQHWQQQVISSSLLRHMLVQGDMASARALLGRPYALHGPVVVGDRLARTWNMPTANIATGLSPWFSGIFAGRIRFNPDLSLPAAIHLGPRPALGKTSWRLEAHALSGGGDWYGQKLSIELWHKLRDVTDFASVEQLKQQIAEDIRHSRDYWAMSH